VSDIALALAVPLSIDWAPEQLPGDVRVEPAALRTHDGAAVPGLLYRRGTPSTVVCLMHPREYFGLHYLVPPLLRTGAAVWTQGSRSIGLDVRLEHEFALLDVAAGLVHLRERGYTRIILLGNSGGAGLFCFYNEQAEQPPADRLAKTAAGRPVPLHDAVLPRVDGIVLVALHPGQGRLLMGCIDPSLVDESDPFSVDPTFDPFASANGFSPKPGASRYSPEFVQRYREAQVARVSRLDDRARALITRRMNARARLKGDVPQPGDATLAAHTPIMTVWRTDADLRCLDLSLDPSDRKPGSVWGGDMLASNYGAVGFGRTCTPESWLSTWSGVSSQAAVQRTAPAIRCPALLVEYTGDQTTFPSTITDIVGWIGGETQHSRVRGDHHGRPLRPGEVPGRLLAGEVIAGWLHEHDYI